MRCVSDLPAVVHHDFVISLLLDYRLHVIGVHHTADLIAMIEPAMGDKDKSRLVRGGILKLTRRRGLGYCPVDERRTLEIDETRRTAPGPLREHRLMGRCAPPIQREMDLRSTIVAQEHVVCCPPTHRGNLGYIVLVQTRKPII